MFKKSIVIDLEMCRLGTDYRRKDYPHRHEIIQIGAVMLNQKGQIIDELNLYVHPVFGRVDHFIQELTGISEKMLVKAPILSDALQTLLDWAGSDCEMTYAWSTSDRNQLLHEITCKHISLPGLDTFMAKERWIDYQEVFGKRFKFSWSMNLQEALMKAAVDTRGSIHNGLDDAYNTAFLIEKLENNPNFELPVQNYSSDEKGNGSLEFSLGELFSPGLLSSLEKS